MTQPMHTRFLHILFSLGLFLFLGTQPGFAQGPTLTRLTTNGRVNPMGIPASDISFSWTAASPDRGSLQQAYQIQVGTTAGSQDIWDSGQVQSDRQVDVVLPSTIPLQSATRYYWQVRVWDNQGRSSAWSTPAWFETGLLTQSDWGTAQWIAQPVQSPNLNAWTDYTVTIDFTIQADACGIFLRSSTDAQTSYMMQVNLTGTTPVFKPHSRTNGTYAVLSTIDLSQFGFTNASLKGTRNTLRFDVSGSTITTALNGITIDTRSGVTLTKGLIGFRTFGTESAAVYRAQVVDKSSNTTMIDPSFAQGQNGFTGGVISNGALYVSGTTDAVFANLPPSLPLFRRAFTARDGIVSARVYASAQGLYEVSVNGQKAGDQFLAPGWTSYNTRIQAQTYDITNLVQPGVNVIGAALADGWFRGKVGLDWTKVYGSNLAFVARIKVTYADGSTDWFSTDSNWKTGNSPYIKADLQDGETYNAVLEQPGWNTTSFDDSSWQPVASAPNVSDRLVPQPDDPIRNITVLTAKSRTQILPGKWIYDLGQNMVGVVKVTLSGTAWQTVTMRHGEELYHTGTLTGQLYTDNLRGAKATDSYTFAASGTITYQPKFTQHGFRYVEISGVTTPPTIDQVQGVVLSSGLTDIGDLQTSNTLLNQLVSNIRWGQRSNFLSIPTDTPARDERLGWTGDINVFAPAAARYRDTRAFLAKWMADVRDSQKPNGNLPAVVPQPQNQFDATGVGWSDAFITVPYAVWKAFGDASILRENWTAMKAFYSFVYNSATSDGDLLEQGRSSWFSGDWLTLETVDRLEEHKVIGTAYFAEDTRMMSEMAAVMGETDQAATWAALVPNIRSAFVSAYRASDGSIYMGTQTVYAMALGMDLIADPAQFAQTASKFIQKLAADNYHLKTGFLGTPWLLPALSKIGRNDLAMKLLLNQDYPSWGFPITMGATTMWERWNSIQPDGTFGPVDMNSFNHYAYGAVGDWMYGNLGGLQQMDSGYKKSRIAPLIGYGGLTSATCSQQTAFGPLATNWSVSAGNLVLTAAIPMNTTAVVCVPASDDATILEGSVPAETSPGVTLLQRQNGVAQYLVGSGSYSFTSVLPLQAPAIIGASPGRTNATLTWTSVPGATSYNLKRSLSSGGPYTTVASGITANSYTDPSLTSGNDYYYVVSAMVGTRETSNSNETVARPRLVLNGGFETPSTTSYLYTPSGDVWTYSGASGNGSGVASNGSAFTSSNPSAPEGTQVAFLQKNGTVSQMVDGLKPGTVYAITFSVANRATAGYSGPQSWEVRVDGAAIASYAPGSAGTSYADFTATFQATATSHVIAFAGTNLNSGDTTVLIDNVRMTVAPPTPTSLTATPGNGGVALTWQAGANATSYVIRRALASGGPYVTIASGVTNSSFTDTAVTNGINYFYLVTGVNADGSSDSTEINAVPSAVTITVPNFGFETLSTSSFVYNPTGASWTFNGAAGNGSGISTNGSTFTSSNASAPQGTQVAFIQKSGSFFQTLTGFAPGGVYTLTFSAANRATAGYNSAESWDVRIDGVTKASFSNKPTSYTDYTASFTASGTSHTLSMVGTSSSDRTVFIDNIRIAGAVPSAPTALGASSAATSQVNLSWAPSSGATSYLIKRATSSGGPYTQLTTVSGTTYSDTASLSAATAYFYVVSAINPVGASGNSSEASATTLTPIQQWRLSQFGTTANSGNASDNADPDGDGLTNLQEFIAGTDPKDRSSFFKVSQLQAGAQGTQITFPTVIGKTYRVEYTDTLQPNSWNVLQDAIPGTGTPIQVTDPGAATHARRFYRVDVM